MKKAFNTLIIVLIIIADLINTANSQYTEIEIIPYISDYEYKILSSNYEKLEPEISKNIKVYSIKEGDNLFKISQKYGIKIGTIKSINGLDISTLNPGKEIFVSDIDGLIHTVKKNESISDIAKQYKISNEEILKYNSFLKKGIKIGDTLFIHKGIFFEESGTELLSNDSYQLNRNTNNKNRFVKGNCTWFVSQYKDINWTGNAKDWLHNAKANYNKVGQIAEKGSIVVFNGKGYNRKYGHVGIVMDIIDNNIIIGDMNYMEINKVTYRKINKNDNAIIGYIY